MIIKWTQTAKDDLQGIWDYISRDSVYYADKFTDELVSAVEVLEVFPEIGRIIPEIGDSDARELIRGSYRIMYLIRGDYVFVTQIIHGARDFGNPSIL